jgi:hypothetical protein
MVEHARRYRPVKALTRAIAPKALAAKIVKMNMLPRPLIPLRLPLQTLQTYQSLPQL